jgi:altronate dehydratase small subunit
MVFDQKLRQTDRRLLLLDEADNVVVAIARIKRGETVVFADTTFVLAADLPIGHKIARCAIAAGAKIIKYGAPIGTATTDIASGAHVHVHNVKSDYTPTYFLKETETLPGSTA